MRENGEEKEEKKEREGVSCRKRLEQECEDGKQRRENKKKDETEVGRGGGRRREEQKRKGRQEEKEEAGLVKIDALGNVGCVPCRLPFPYLELSMPPSVITSLLPLCPQLAATTSAYVKQWREKHN